MLKKIFFILLVFSFMIAGAVVSMANEDEDFILNKFTVNNAASSTYFEEEFSEEQTEKYSHEAVIEAYSSLFFDADNNTEVEYIKEEKIRINADSATKDDIHDHYLSATLSEDVQLEKGDTIVVMVFIQSDDTYELLCDPAEFDPAECNMGFIKRIRINLPNVGKDNPNYIRIIAFPKNSYNELSLNNIQIYDTEVIITMFDVKETLKQLDDILKPFYNIIPN